MGTCRNADGDVITEVRMGNVEKVIRAEQFHVIDCDGRIRAVLGMQDGEPSLEMLRTDGSVGVSVGSISVTGYDCRDRAYMTATPHDYGEIGVTDRNNGVVLLNECG